MSDYVNDFYTEDQTENHLKKLAVFFVNHMFFEDDYGGGGTWGLDPMCPFRAYENLDFTVEQQIRMICDIGMEIEEYADSEMDCYVWTASQIQYAQYLYKERLGPFIRDTVKAALGVEVERT